MAKEPRKPLDPELVEKILKATRSPLADMNFIPPVKIQPKQPQTSVAEFIALKTLVMALAADRAVEYEATGRGAAQDYINALSAICQESIAKSQLTGLSSGQVDTIRAAALSNINNILSGVMVPKARDKSN